MGSTVVGICGCSDRRLAFVVSGIDRHHRKEMTTVARPYNTNLPPNLRSYKEEIEGYARGYGLDFFDTIFEVIDADDLNEMANHGARIRHYVEKHGEDDVETFVDRCMSIDDLIDIHSTAIRRREVVSRYDFSPEKEDESVRATRFKSKDYMDAYVNPREVL